VTVQASEPLLSTHVLDSVVRHTEERVRAIRTAKTRQNLDFAQARFAEAEQEMRAAEERLADFLDRNRNPESAMLSVERDRLERRVRFKRELYGQMQTQVAQAELELQRSEPVVTVIEAAAPPLQRSAPRRTLIVLLSLVGGVAVGVAVVFARTLFDSEPQDAEERAKLEEVRRVLRPVTRRYHALRARLPRLLSPSRTTAPDADAPDADAPDADAPDADAPDADAPDADAPDASTSARSSRAGSPQGSSS
jgi:uncharacterized protein involved in exopolysaccharide biosynthesis